MAVRLVGQHRFVDRYRCRIVATQARFVCSLEGSHCWDRGTRQQQ